MATSISVFFVMFFSLFAGKMIQIFINNEQVIEHGIRIMRALLIALPFAGIQFLIRVSFQALGKGRPALILALTRQGLFYIPSLFFLNKYFGLSGFIYAQPFANVLTFILAVLLFNRIRGQISEEQIEVESEIVTAATKLDDSLQKCN